MPSQSAACGHPLGQRSAPSVRQTGARVQSPEVSNAPEVWATPHRVTRPSDGLGAVAIELGELIGELVHRAHVELGHRLDLPVASVQRADPPRVSSVPVNRPVVRMNVELHPPAHLAHGEVEMQFDTVVAGDDNLRFDRNAALQQRVAQLDLRVRVVDPDPISTMLSRHVVVPRRAGWQSRSPTPASSSGVTRRLSSNWWMTER